MTKQFVISASTYEQLVKDAQSYRDMLSDGKTQAEERPRLTIDTIDQYQPAEVFDIIGAEMVKSVQYMNSDHRTHKLGYQTYHYGTNLLPYGIGHLFPHDCIHVMNGHEVEEAIGCIDLWRCDQGRRTRSVPIPDNVFPVLEIIQYISDNVKPKKWEDALSAFRQFLFGPIICIEPNKHVIKFLKRTKKSTKQ